MNVEQQHVEPVKAYLERLFADTRQKLELQQRAVMLCLDGMEAMSSSSAAATQQQVLLAALQETVEVLEETKRSFKSKRLGELRAKLERVLAENGKD
jgi:hypothetical protein